MAKKYKLKEFTSGNAITALIGAYLFRKMKGDNSTADKIATSLKDYDAEIERDLNTISRKVQQNAKAIEKDIAKLSKKDKDEVEHLANLFAGK